MNLYFKVCYNEGVKGSCLYNKVACDLLNQRLFKCVTDATHSYKYKTTRDR
jgi:hypothetical protein